jgi:ubiquinone/menaquinone biosynthesis C-methylase UbiE
MHMPESNGQSNDHQSGHQTSEPQDTSVHDLVTKFLGDSFHPGSEAVTIQLGNKLGLSKGQYILLIGCGTGKSAITLARSFECSVLGIDQSENNVTLARQRAEKAGFNDQLEFVKVDGNTLEFFDRTFDAVVSDCAFRAFADKTTVCSEIYRVLKPARAVGVMEIFIESSLPEKIEKALAFLGAGTVALSKSELIVLLERVGFSRIAVEDHNENIQKLLAKARALLPGLSLAKRFIDRDLEGRLGFAVDEVPGILDAIESETGSGNISYSILTASK